MLLLSWLRDHKLESREKSQSKNVCRTLMLQPLKSTLWVKSEGRGTYINLYFSSVINGNYFVFIFLFFEHTFPLLFVVGLSIVAWYRQRNAPWVELELLRNLRVIVNDLVEPLQDPGLVRTHSTYQMTLMVPMTQMMGSSLDDEPGSLLNYHRTKREVLKRRVIRSVFGLSFDVKVTIYGCLIL